MYVTVPVAATLKSPRRRTAPIASPAANSLAAGIVLVVDVDEAPLGTGMKPIGSRYLPKRPSVSGAKLDMESGTAIGLAPPSDEAGEAPARLLIISSNFSAVLC